MCLEVFEDGWIKARNQHGETGFVPADYVDGGPVVSGRRVVPSDSPTKESASGSSPLRGAGGGDYAAAGAGNPAMLAHSPGGAISPPPQIPENTAPAGGVGDTVSRKQVGAKQKAKPLLSCPLPRLTRGLTLLISCSMTISSSSTISCSTSATGYRRRWTCAGARLVVMPWPGLS